MWWEVTVFEANVNAFDRRVVLQGVVGEVGYYAAGGGSEEVGGFESVGFGED